MIEKLLFTHIIRLYDSILRNGISLFLFHAFFLEKRDYIMSISDYTHEWFYTTSIELRAKANLPKHTCF